MDLMPTAEQELIRSTARDLLRERVPTAGARTVRGGSGYCAQLWKEMVGLGWPGLAVPERHGGAGAGFADSCLLFEELGAAQVPSPLLVGTACAAMPLVLFGTDEQRSSWLPAIAAGRTVGYAGTGAGSAVTAVAGSGGFTLTGTADYVPFGAAEALVVVATTEVGRTVFLVDTTQVSGVDAGPIETVGPGPRHRVRFDGVTVPSDAVLGRVDGGGEVVAAAEAFGAAATCAEMVGGAQRVLDMTVAYAGTRRQFGRPVGSFQAVQHHCADMAIDVLGARFIAYEAAWRLGDDPGGSEAALTVSAAKAWVSDAYERVCARGHQVHGAIGFTAEHDLHLYTCHATSAALAFGDADTHTDVVADALGLPT